MQHRPKCIECTQQIECAMRTSLLTELDVLVVVYDSTTPYSLLRLAQIRLQSYRMIIHVDNRLCQSGLTYKYTVIDDKVRPYVQQNAAGLVYRLVAEHSGAAHGRDDGTQEVQPA